jgi:hypothetical protein
MCSCPHPLSSGQLSCIYLYKEYPRRRASSESFYSDTSRYYARSSCAIYISSPTKAPASSDAGCDSSNSCIRHSGSHLSSSEVNSTTGRRNTGIAGQRATLRVVYGGVLKTFAQERGSRLRLRGWRRGKLRSRRSMALALVGFLSAKVHGCGRMMMSRRGLNRRH